MTAPVKVGIVGLGRWAKVLTRAGVEVRKRSRSSPAYSRSQEKRAAFAARVRRRGGARS